MALQPVLVDPDGGSIHQVQVGSGELLQVCFEGTCLYCESLHVGMAHLKRMQRSLTDRPGT